MYKDAATNGCSRFGMTDSYVPFQPNANPAAAAGKDDAILYGAVVRTPAGCPRARSSTSRSRASTTCRASRSTSRCA